MKNIIIPILAAIMSTMSYAATTNTTLKPSAKLNASCVISNTSVDLGEIVSTGGTSHSSGSSDLKILCTRGTAFKLYQSWGIHGSGAGRLLRGATSRNTIRYFVCSGPGVTNDNCANDKRWYPEDVAIQGYFLTGSATGVAQSYPVYVNVLKTYATPDNYSDSITTTITY